MEHIEEGILKRYPNGTITLNKGYDYCYECQKCNLKKYWYKNKQKKSIGPCKDCINKIIDNDIIKAIPYFDMFNIPIMLHEWKFLKERNKGKPIFGKYLSYCKLRSFVNMNFTDGLQYEKTYEDYYSKEEINNIKQEFIKYITKKIHIENW